MNEKVEENNNNEGTKVGDAKPHTIVEVTVPSLNIRKGPGKNFKIVGITKSGEEHAIIKETTGEGSDNGWGKLKSGAGWISLDHVTEV